VAEGDEKQDDLGLLAEMMAFGGEGALWRPEELAGIFRHQLDARLAFDFDSLDVGLGKRVEEQAEKASPPIRTFRDLLWHPQPPVELLDLAKRFAKSCAGRPGAALPEEIARVLYALSIVVGMTRCGQRITELDDRQLREQLDWAAALPWLDDAARGLLAEGRRQIGTSPPGAATDETDVIVLPREEQAPPPEMSAMRRGIGQLGEYVLLEKLGEGGMGTVYKALHTELDRLVAIKVMRRGSVEEDWAVARFRREIKAVGQFDHPHIVRAHDARKIGDTHFLVMEYVDGLDLNELVDRCGPLATADACELVRQAALGLQCAHEHGLVHRDIKPSNLMLDRRGQVKILDLGLVRVHAVGESGGEMTVVGQVMGTPDYMAPEQMSGSRTIDIGADIYSLGCTLYRLLAGHAPFSGPEYQSLLAKMAAHKEQKPRPVAELRKDVPGQLDGVLARMLAKTAGERFSTPAEVAEALGRFSQGSDLRALLARAEGKAIDGDVRVGAGAVAASATSKGRRLLGWVAAACLMVLIAVGGVVWMLSGRDGQRAGESLAVSVKKGEVVSPPVEKAERKPVEKVVPPPTEKAVQPPIEKTVPPPTVPAKKSEKKAVEPERKAPVVAADRAAESPGWIVLSWTRPRMGRPSLWLFSPDGKSRARITNDSRYYDIHPKFSPDGRRIAFIRGGGIAEPNSVCVCNADGSQFRTVVASRDKFEWFASPVWISDSRIYYARAARDASMEIWQVDLDGGEPRLVFRMKDATGKPDGLVTDVSRDGRLALIAQSGGLSSTSNVYVTDREGKHVQTVWSDSPDEWKDARALWSPDGTRLAWHHNFTRGLLAKRIQYGVGMARCDATGKWDARLQPSPEGFVTPLVWAPRGDLLLCAQLHEAREPKDLRERREEKREGKLAEKRELRERLPTATLCLMDEQFRVVTVLFELEACPWQPAQRDPGRLADWAIVPADVVIPAGP
jgi:tRNA A-37 threonylcarbamoyl transferase component Bud32